MIDWKLEIRRRMASLALTPTREAAIIEELAQHLADCYSELLSSGATEAEAYQRTLAELSGSELLAVNYGGWNGKSRPNLSCWEAIGGQI